jgi:hypothetical protein
VSIFTPEDEVVAVTAVTMWPNPATDNVNISGSSDFDTVTVYDYLGKMVMHQPILGSSVDISNLISGLYIFRLSGNSETINKRIIKK